MAKLNLEYCDPSSLRPFEGNPRSISEEGLEKLQASVEHFGFTNPILAQKESRTIIAGHQRLKAALAAGLSEVPVIWLDFDDEMAKAYNLADNRLNQESDWEFQALADLLLELDSGSFDVTVTGFDEKELEELMTWTPAVDMGDIVEDEAPEPPQEAKTKAGELWLLGEHRLLCGDSESLEDIQTLMAGQSADLVVTDPPYNVDYTGKTKDSLKIQGDSQTDQHFDEFLETVFSNLYQVTKDGASIYVFYGPTEGASFILGFKGAGYKLAQCCVWVKQSMVMGRQDYQWKHEGVLYGWKPTAAHNWYADAKQTTVWEFDRPTANKEHPTMKPVALCVYPISNSSKKNQIVLDGFGGSGSTLIACEQTERSCYMMELDPKYCDVILTRWANFSGQQPVLESTGQTWAERQEAGHE